MVNNFISHLKKLFKHFTVNAVANYEEFKVEGCKFVTRFVIVAYLRWITLLVNVGRS